MQEINLITRKLESEPPKPDNFMIPLLDLNRAHAPLHAELMAVCENVLKEGKFIMGPAVGRFESAVAAYVGVPHAISCASGSDALLVALMALGLRPGDEVVTTAYSFFSTASAITRLGLSAKFADIDPGTFNLTPASLQRSLTANTKAVIAVHLFGQTCEIAEISGICRSRGIRLVEDAAQSLGASFQGTMAGAFGDIGCYSFFPSKNLGGFGDGGMMVTADAALAEQMSILRLHGAKPKYYHQQVGIGSRLDTLQAALLEVKLAHLDAYAAGRQRNARLYRELLAGVDGVLLPDELPGAVPVYNQFCIRTQARDALRQTLSDQGIGTEIYYPIPLHLQECFRDLGYKEGDFPIAEECAKTSMALPIFGDLTEGEVREVAGAIRSFFASNSSAR